jgi:hypothetical protein
LVPNGQPIEPDSGEATINKVAGIAWMVVAVAVVCITYWLLPKGHYPALLIALPALPFVLLAWSRFKKVGWGTHVEEVDLTTISQSDEVLIAEEKRMPKWWLWLIGAAILLMIVIIIILMDKMKVGP